MTLFYRNNLISLLGSLVRKGSKCFVVPVTDLTIPTSRDISAYLCYQASISEEKTYCENDYNKVHHEDTNSVDNIEVTRACNLLLSKGVDKTFLKKYEKYLLKSPKQSYMKAKLLTDLPFNTLTILPLLKLPVSRLKWVLMRSKEDQSIKNDFHDRISYLCYHLELDPDRLINLLSKHSTLLTMDFSRLQNKLVILKNADISAEYLVKDLWIFNYNENLLLNRIEKAKLAGVSIKPWLLRCSEKSFISILSKSKNTRVLLNGKNEISFLAQKLNCSEDYVKYMISRNKLLTAINVPKLEQVINFLYEKGYTPEEVRIFPRIFCSSVKTLSKNFEEFYDVKGTMPTMSQLCFSSKH